MRNIEQMKFWEEHERETAEIAESTDEYERFVAKFKPKKTTDDCYTPTPVYNAIADWVAGNYGLDRAKFVRPFYPGGDYKRFDYFSGCVVVDNPPFSILAEILRFYSVHAVPFFLFAPTLTLFSRSPENFCCIPNGADITYENGAVVNTSFVTSLEPPELCVRCYPDLYRLIDTVNKANVKSTKKELPKYAYPDYILTAAMAYQYAHYGVEYSLDRRECVKVDALDSQKNAGKSIFGKGYLLSERAAAERAAAERAAAERAAATKWQLSDREREIIRSLGKQKHRGGLPAEGKDKK